MTRTNGDSTGDGIGRYPVTEAANILGISTEATRQRIKRGTLPTERDEEGNVFVLLKGNGTRTTADSTRTDADGTDDGTPGGTHTNANRTGDGTDEKERLIQFLSEQLEHEREVNRENRRIIAGLVQRVPELEAVPEPRDSSVIAADYSGDGTTGKDDLSRPQRRSWLYRFFFGPE